MATGPANSGGSPSPQKPGTSQAKPAAPATPGAARPASVPASPASAAPRAPSAARPLVGPPGSRPPASAATPARPPVGPPGSAPRPQSAGPAPARPAGAAPAAKPASVVKPTTPGASPAGPSATGIPRLSGVRQALNPNAPSSVSGRQSSVVPTKPAGSAGSGRTPSSEVPANNNVSTDRAKLGLGAKPSEMIAGLDDYAKRVEKQEAREEAKRKAGGKISQNEALKVDDTGKRWQRNVIIGIVGIAVIVGIVVVVMAFFANIDKVDPKIANRNTRDMLTQLVGFVQRLPNGEADASGDRIKDLLREQIDLQLKQVEADIARDQERRKKESKHRPPDNRLYREQETLTALRKFQDPFGQPFTFSVSDGELTISAKGKPEGGPIEPVVAKLPGAASKPAEKTK